MFSLLETATLADEPAKPSPTGPQTEKRFPSLVVPDGFKSTLFACDPLVEYPSVISLGPKTGTLFVAHDYVTGLGIAIIRRDEIRLLSDTDGDGYADKSIVYAAGFNSIQGLAYHDGSVYAMHAPLLTALRDTNGDGVADERRDLLTGLGLVPEKNPSRLHCANGVTVGHDGWLYLSMGDNGTYVRRPEGDRLVFTAGGILRCRPNGRDLHVFATGLRNIYDVALDEQLNVFVRDNENDGGDYLLRIFHSFHGADHGYPYLYYEHPDEAVQPLAILGRGSSAGAVCYLETAFPPEMRGNLFFCEWGRAVVRAERKPLGSSFAPMTETDFAAGAPNDPYGFKPTDVIVDRDGSLVISDWCDGQRPKRGRGRIYRITYQGTSQPAVTEKTPDDKDVAAWIKQLNSPSYFQRLVAQTALERQAQPTRDAIFQAMQNKSLEPLGRLHGVWLLASLGGRDSIEELFSIAKSDPEPMVRAQAVRVIADLTDPRFIQQKLEADRGDAAIAGRLATLAVNEQDSKLRLDVINTLARLRWAQIPIFLKQIVKEPDSQLAHAAQQALRSCNNRPAVLALLDDPADSVLRQIALRAMADESDPVLVRGLLDRLRSEGNAKRRLEYADLLCRAYQRPGPWVYWGYRPPPRPPNSKSWERTEVIGRTLNDVLADPDRAVRAAILKRMQREQIPIQGGALCDWLIKERNEGYVTIILESLQKDSSDEANEKLREVVQDQTFSVANRLQSLAIWVGRLNEATQSQLLDLAKQVEVGLVLEKLLVELGKRPTLDSTSLLLIRLGSPVASVRAAALAALTQLRKTEVTERIPKLLQDPDIQVRRVAARAAGSFSLKSSAGALVALTRDTDPETRGICLHSLKILGDSTAVEAAVDALNDPLSQAAAIEYLGEFGGPPQTAALMSVAATSRSSETLAGIVAAFANWEGKLEANSLQGNELRAAVAKLQGESGIVFQWRARNWGDQGITVNREAILRLLDNSQSAAATNWKTLLATGPEQRVDLGMTGENENLWLAYSDVTLADATTAQFLTSSSGSLQVWINGVSVYERSKPGTYQPEADRFEAKLEKGANRIGMLVTSSGAAQFHLRFRRKGSSADHERLTQFALQDAGNIERGRELFFNAEKSLCMKCHRVQNLGGQIGPDLTGIGSRFARIHLIESILEPSRTIAPSYETTTVVLSNGRVITGVKVSESDSVLIMGDDQGKTHNVSKSDIEERIKQPRSTMPEGLEKRLTDREFLDLLTFLISQRKPNGTSP